MRVTPGTAPSTAWPALTPMEPLTLVQTAEACGRYRWVEQRLFEVTGAWARSAEDGGAQLYLHRWSRIHGWHAELWAARRPRGTVIDDVGDAPPPAGDPLRAAIDGLAERPARPAPAGAALAELTGAVLPGLAASYREHLRRAGPVADGPIMRVLALALADIEEEMAAGRTLAGWLDRP